MAGYLEDLLKDFEQNRGSTVPDHIRKVFLTYPRHEFLPENQKPRAGIDRPLPLLTDLHLPGDKRYDVTQSQPSMVLEMLWALELGQKIGKVLEVGFGTGWVLAMLSDLCEETYGIDVFPYMCNAARSNLERMGCKAHIHEVPFSQVGLLEHGPYDRILVSCAFPEARQIELIEQIAPGGLAIVPITTGGTADCLLTRIRKSREGEVSSSVLISCRFVDFL